MVAPYKYPPMLGSPESVPFASPEWAERQGQRIKLAVESVERNGINHLIPALERALDAQPYPWEVFPREKPSGTPDAWFQLMAGITCANLCDLIHAYHPNHPLIRRLDIDKAKATKMPKHGEIGGGHPGNTRPNNVSSGYGNKAGYLLARLARDRPDILDAFERGEYPSARAAAIAAGIIKPPTPYQVLCRAWKKASGEERHRFWKEVAEDTPYDEGGLPH